MPEMHLKQIGFTYSACGPVTKDKERIEKIMQTWNTEYISKNDLYKASFNMIWLMVNLKILLKEHKLIKF